MDPTGIKAWIFDMDGTLTVAMHDFEAIRAELGLESGRPILEQLSELPAADQAERRARLDRIEMKLASNARPAAGARVLLESLRDRPDAPPVGILTRNSFENSLETLRAAGLLEFFARENIISRDNAPPKPDPAGIRLLLEKWRIAPARAAMIGDYVFDLQAARAAGAWAVYVDPAGEFPFSEYADWSIRGLRELLRPSA